MISMLWLRSLGKAADMILVCKNCTNRIVGCHSNCPKYLEEKRIHDEKLEEKRQRINNDSIHTDFVKRGVAKSLKRRRR